MPINIEQNFKDILKYLQCPAVLIKLESQEIIDSNARALDIFGPKASQGSPIHLNVSSDCRLNLVENELLEFEACQESPYSIKFYTENYALIIHDPGRMDPMSEASDISLYPSFHYSYMQNLGTGLRQFSDSSFLHTLELAAESTDVSSFNWESRIHPDDQELYQNMIKTAIEHGGNHRIRYRVRTLKEQIIEITDICGTTREEGKRPRLVGSIVSNEHSAKRFQRLEKLCLIGRLCGGMVHDFRNLLGGMQNMIEWCMAQSPAGGLVYKALNKTINYTDQANGLIRSTMNLIGQRSEDEIIEKVNTSEIIYDVEALIKHFASQDVEIQVLTEENIAPIHGQKSILMHMILNLCLNACDAMKGQENGLLRIQGYTKSIEDEQGKPEKFVCIRVEDNGCGMSEKHSQSIFEEFYSTKKDGAGLGLWMVKQAVRSFDGIITVESELDKGTSFVVRFPLVEPDEGTKVIEDTPTRNLDFNAFDNSSQKTILFIEDEPLLRNGVATWLDTFGFKLLIAEDGHGALKLFDENEDEIDVIIQDFILPGINGDKLLEKFSSRRPDLPIIIVSGFAASSEGELKDHEWMTDRGAFAFLPKPFKIEDLVGLLHEAFDAIE
ncbi:MAG: response regulator [Lentisphaeria bacterium]|nr:ATP-binding protein [Lentisphaeria bacterium]NQZ69511.1 response regulator [Lentisphaeria bacterium]